MTFHPLQARAVRLSALASAFLALLASTSGATCQSFETLASGGVRVEYIGRQAALAREVMEAARTPMELPGIGRRGVPGGTTIVLAPSEAAFQQATGGDVPEWAGGVAIPEERRIVLPAYAGARVRDDDRATVLRHEVAHEVLHETVPGILPRWFDEGYAEVASGGWDVQSAWQLRVAFVSGALPPLDSLTLDWPTRESDARTAYLLSATAVDYLRRRGGERGMALLFSNWRDENDFDRALRTTFGITLGQFEEEWRHDVAARYGWLAILSDLALVWLVAAGLVLAAWIPRRRRNRLKLAQMEAEEHMLPAPRPELAGVDYPLAEYPDDEDDSPR